MILLAAALALTGAQAAAPQAVPNMAVSGDQLDDALARCRDQLAGPALAGESLTAAGWPEVASIAAKGDGPALAMFRNPGSMLLLTLADHADKPDQCAVMVPFGRLLDAAQIEDRVASFAGAKPRNGAWATAGFTITREPMGSGGVRYLLTEKAA